MSPRNQPTPPPARPLWKGGWLAVLAALTFGVTTPLIQRVGEGVGVFSTAALLYGGAALTAGGWRPRREAREAREAPVSREHLPRLVLVAIAGAVVAPACLAWGLKHTSATTASLLLNLEAVFTVALARVVFGEPVGGRVAAALALMLAGGTTLVLGGSSLAPSAGLGAAAVLLAAFGWAADNTLTRPLADVDPAQVVRIKAGLGAAMSLALALLAREPRPAPGAIVGLALCGATGYGLSLRLYLRAQRLLGAARTGSIFALAPFVGAATAWLLGDRAAGLPTLLSGALLLAGVYLHLSEQHAHEHLHEPLDHEHAHRHDDGHHDHPHDPPVEGEHSHPHHHPGALHAHPHAPDLHHRHRHD